jgi:hypothetical protein
LILSGLSQGGGAAVVAAIALKEYDPITFNFGGMRAVVLDKKDYPCEDVDRNRQFLFVNTFYKIYDSMVMIQQPLKAIQIGHTILMDGDNYPMAHVGLDDNVKRIPYTILIHTLFSYEKRIRQMLKIHESCYPIPVGAWPDGHYCSYQDECGSQAYCINKRCSDNALQQGEKCHEDGECESGVCAKASWWFLRKRCQ